MLNLDDKEAFEIYDKGKFLSTIRLLPDQIEQSWEDLKYIDIPKSYYNIENVVICGMGGSALGGRIVDSLIASRVRVPIEVFTEYDIPNYVSSKSLVIISSYSGNTEETINAAREAINKNAKIFGITTNGKLKEIFEKNNIPAFIFDPKYNPSNQPRMGLGYSISTTLGILSKAKFIHLTDEEIYKLAVKIREFIKDYDIDKKEQVNVAKKTANKLINKIPVLVSSEHLYGVSYAMKNQINENSKNFSVLFDIPELNHHLLEGLKHPSKARELLYFIFIKSDLYRKEIKKRYEITSDVVGANGYRYINYSPISEKKLDQIFEILTFGSFLSFYLSYLNKEDVSSIPWVDYFKAKLAKV